MARTKGALGKATQAKQLSDALAFVAVAGTKDDQPYKMHVVLNGGYAVASDGQLSAGYPIAEELECCPHLGLLTIAIAKSGKTLAITELETGSLSVKGDKPKFIVPCLSFDAMPDIAMLQPDPSCAVIDDRLKQAFAVCGTLVSESATTFLEASLLLEANTVTATNRATLMQYWHGIDLPPGLVVPKIFAAAVCKTKSPLVGFGFKPGCSVTFHFENGSWLRTLLYENAYPDIARIIDKPTLEATPLATVPVPAEFFEAIATVAQFSDKGDAYFSDGLVTSHGGETNSAEFEIDGLNSTLSFASEQMKLIAPYATSIDLTTFEDRAYFFGDKMRGTIMACGRRVARAEVLDMDNFELGSNTPAMRPETTEEWRARGGTDDEIPF